jgi:predicted Rossmann-fold nucleotide-binding protein
VVIVACGSRQLAWPPGRIQGELLAAAGCRPVLAVFHGGSRGADQLVDQEAHRLGWPVRVRMARWSEHGIAAGPIRNRQMLAHAGALATVQGAVLVLLAFPGGVGTASCIREARRWHRLSDGRVPLELIALAAEPEA